MFDRKTKFMQRDYFSKISLKSYLPQQTNPNLPQPGHRIQPIKLLVSSPSTLEPRTQVSSLLIKPKTLKPNLTIPSQVPLPNWEPNKHTRNL